MCLSFPIPTTTTLPSLLLSPCQLSRNGLYQGLGAKQVPLAFLLREQAVLVMADTSLSLLQGAEISSLTN